MKKIFWISLLYIIFVSCTKTYNDRATTKDDLLAEVNDSDQTESLILRNSDTVCSTNPELLILLDTLCQHVQSEGFPASAKEEEKWMNAYRQKLCAYYDSHEKDGANKTEFEKADYVLDEGTHLIESGGDDSTMGMIVKNNTIYTFYVMREYGQLSQMLKNCPNVETLDLVYKEWDLYSQLSQKMSSLAVKIARLTFWGGSIVGPISTGRSLQISESRIEMYQTVLDIINKDSWDCSGVFLENAQQLLHDCSVRAVNDISSEMKEYLDEEDEEGYEATITSAEKTIEELRPLLKEWAILWNEIDKEFTSDGSRHEMERAASSMLIKWASIVCERW